MNDSTLDTLNTWHSKDFRNLAALQNQHNERAKVREKVTEEANNYDCLFWPAFLLSYGQFLSGTCEPI